MDYKLKFEDEFIPKLKAYLNGFNSENATLYYQSNYPCFLTFYHTNEINYNTLKVLGSLKEELPEYITFGDNCRYFRSPRPGETIVGCGPVLNFFYGHWFCVNNIMIVDVDEVMLRILIPLIMACLYLIDEPVRFESYLKTYESEDIQRFVANRNIFESASGLLQSIYEHQSSNIWAEEPDFVFMTGELRKYMLSLFIERRVLARHASIADPVKMRTVSEMLRKKGLAVSFLYLSNSTGYMDLVQKRKFFTSLHYLPLTDDCKVIDSQIEENRIFYLKDIAAVSEYKGIVL